MKVEIIRELLTYEQEMVDWLSTWHPATRDELLPILRRKLDERRTAGSDRLIEFDFDRNGHVVLLNNPYWSAGPFCRLMLTQPDAEPEARH